MPTATYDKIMTYTVPSSTTSYTFTAIPITYTDLVLIVNFRSASTGDTRCSIRVGNGSVDTGNNYSVTALVGSGTTAYSGRDTTRSNFDSYINEAESTSSEFSLNIFQFMNYSNTTTNKTVLIRENTQSVGAGMTPGTAAVVGLYRSTVALNTIQVFDLTGKSIAANSSFTLYGIKAA
jgi:hypothetical protein